MLQSHRFLAALRWNNRACDVPPIWPLRVIRRNALIERNIPAALRKADRLIGGLVAVIYCLIAWRARSTMSFGVA